MFNSSTSLTLPLGEEAYYEELCADSMNLLKQPKSFLTSVNISSRIHISWLVQQTSLEGKSQLIIIENYLDQA